MEVTENKILITMFEEAFKQSPKIAPIQVVLKIGERSIVVELSTN